MKSDRYYLSQAKFEELGKELELLKSEKRRGVASRLEYAKSLGDLSENAEYHTAREDQVELEDRISELENILKSSEIIKNQHTDYVGVGSKLTVKKDGNGAAVDYKIVGPEEVDLATGLISYESPLGAALLNKRKGDKVKVKTPQGKIVYQIIKLF